MRFSILPAVTFLIVLSACSSTSKRTRGKLKPGEIDRAGIRETVADHKEEILSCYSAVLDKDPSLQGKVVVNFDIDKGGRVVKVAVDDAKSTLRNADFSSCLIHSFSGWTFPGPPEKRVVEASYPLYFSP